MLEIEEMNIPYIKIEQPLGSFFLTSIRADILIRMVQVKHRKIDDPEGIQRELSHERVGEISNFCKDSDAVFPTPIVISVYSSFQCEISSNYISFSEEQIIGQIIDGQHRLAGIWHSGKADIFELPVVLMFGLNAEENAYIFSTINGTQTKVNKSLIYDLFELSTHRSPQRTCHVIARAMNSDINSPFYNRLKMLGKKEPNQEIAVLSQATFVTQVSKLISKDPNKDTQIIKEKGSNWLEEDLELPLRKYFINEQDDIIYKILLNTFYALKNIFLEEWKNADNNILWKTTGFCGIIFVLNDIISIGIKDNTLTVDFFSTIFDKFKKYIIENKIPLTSTKFIGGGQQNQILFANYLRDSLGISKK